MQRYLWTQKQDFGPAARRYHALAYDSVRKRVVLFGGESQESLFNDTWEWDGANWVQVADTGPGARTEHAMAFDEVNKAVLLFGGRTVEGMDRETWQWNGEDWTQLRDGGPQARCGHAMTSLSGARTILLFGGAGAETDSLADTWQWDGNEWTEIADTGPAARRNHSLAYDGIRNRAVLFGGSTNGVQAFNDTWEWNGHSWVQEADFGPVGRVATGLAFGGGRVLMFGGRESADAASLPRAFGDTWEWSGTLWTQRQDIGPSRRWGHAVAYDLERRRLVLFGGALNALQGSTADYRPQSDTWEHPDNEAALLEGPPIIKALTLDYNQVTRTGAGLLRLSHYVPGTSVSVSLTASEAVVFAPAELVLFGQQANFLAYVDVNLPVGSEVRITATLSEFSKTVSIIV